MSHSGMTGREAAERLLRGAGIYDVRVEYVSGNLTDHYDPRNKVLRLSSATYNQSSVCLLYTSPQMIEPSVHVYILLQQVFRTN